MCWQGKCLHCQINTKYLTKRGESHLTQVYTSTLWTLNSPRWKPHTARFCLWKLNICLILLFLVSLFSRWGRTVQRRHQSVKSFVSLHVCEFVSMERCKSKNTKFQKLSSVLLICASIISSEQLPKGHSGLKDFCLPVGFVKRLQIRKNWCKTWITAWLRKPLRTGKCEMHFFAHQPRSAAPATHQEIAAFRALFPNARMTFAGMSTVLQVRNRIYCNLYFIVLCFCTPGNETHATPTWYRSVPLIRSRIYRNHG